ncbi:MAG: hypothetical protein MK235_02480 [Candidatus Poseidoniales archaeon]|nr:hypothetical protein [Candidatus Poseidoniales archaeon]
MAEEGEFDTPGASLPEGIEVDEAAAYFGITDSSDVIVRLSQSDRLNGLGEFLALTVDLVLKDEFDFQSAAARLGCEDGEVYYLLSGPFGLLTMTDPLRRYLGQADSGGEIGPHPGIPESEIAALDQLNDIMVLMRMVAIAHLVGGLRLLDHTLVTFEAWVLTPGAHKQQLLALSAELDNALNEAKAGSISPLNSLGVPTAAPAPAPAPTAAAPAPAPQPEPQPIPAPTPVHAPIQPDVQPQPAPSPAPVQPTVPPQPAPVQPVVPPQPDPVVSAPPPQPMSKPAPVPAPASPQPPATTETLAPGLSPRPMGEQVPEETVAQPAPETAQVPAPLPQPVAPARPPVASAQPAPAPAAPKPESAQDRVADLVSRPGAPAEGVHHHIQSGRFCGSCGIGVEQQWRHCPVCSTSL